LFKSLGLDFVSSVVKIELHDIIIDEIKKEINPAHYEVKLIAPKNRKTYPAF
jgi:hypothetical protein